MAKIITDSELATIVRDIVDGDVEISDAELYKRFVKDLADLICNYTGGEAGTYVDYMIGVEEDSPDFDRYTIAIYADENVPSDGGVWKDYDTDVTVDEWINNT